MSYLLCLWSNMDLKLNTPIACKDATIELTIRVCIGYLGKNKVHTLPFVIMIMGG